MNIPRGKYTGTRTGLFGDMLIERMAPDEAVHFMACEACGGLIDCRDLGAVCDHEGPLPHPTQDRKQ